MHRLSPPFLLTLAESDRSEARCVSGNIPERSDAGLMTPFILSSGAQSCLLVSLTPRNELTRDDGRPNLTN